MSYIELVKHSDYGNEETLMISVPASESQIKGKKAGVGGERLCQLYLGLVLTYWISAKSSKNM